MEIDRLENLVNLTIILTRSRMMIDTDRDAANIKLASRPSSGRTRVSGRFHAITPPPNSDFCFAGAFGLDRSSQGSLCIDAPGRVRQPFVVLSAQNAAADPTCQHAGRFGAIRSRLQPERTRSAIPLRLAGYETHIKTAGSSLSQHWPCLLGLPRPPSTLLDRTAPVDSFESTQNPPPRSFRPSPRSWFARGSQVHTI
jgi:hypothetical protein